MKHKINLTVNVSFAKLTMGKVRYINGKKVVCSCNEESFIKDVCHPNDPNFNHCPVRHRTVYYYISTSVEDEELYKLSDEDKYDTIRSICEMYHMSDADSQVVVNMEKKGIRTRFIVNNSKVEVPTNDKEELDKNH